MKFPEVTPLEWRAQVDKELRGASFEKTLVQRTPEGLSILPLYSEVPPGGPLAIDCQGAPFRICMRHDAAAADGALADDLDGGADALWLEASSGPEADGLLGRVDLARTFVMLEVEGEPAAAILDRVARRASGADVAFALATDPFGAFARGRSSAAALPGARAALAEVGRLAGERFPRATTAMVSTVPYHDAGADAADEVAIALATGVAYLGTLIDAGLAPAAAARQIALRIAVGRDTFAEMCKLRALRAGWQKVVAAAGVSEAPHTLVHAVCSSRSLTQRDPWVNMLRVTTQVFAAVLGGADLVTPAAFDQALGPASALGRRIARNTGLVLREESYLGRVVDPAGGSYYLETLTDALAREAWKRFQAIEREGGIEAALVSGRLRARLEASWRERLELIAKRKAPILGVSEFANLNEKLPRPPPTGSPEGAMPSHRDSTEGAMPSHRDAEPFERLRTRADAAGAPLEVLLVTLGSFAESRPRVGFAAGFFGAGGLRTRETTHDEAATVACVCGSDETYAAEAVARVTALKAAGCKRVLVAGRPGALEAALHAAGADGYVFVGCDAVAILSELLDVYQ
jgi:methylmalonyl-CoA mutase